MPPRPDPKLHATPELAMQVTTEKLTFTLMMPNKYGNTIYFWDPRVRKNVQTVDVGENHQVTLEIQPAHGPAGRPLCLIRNP